MERLSRIVELVGPAGAGKTTLAEALKQHSDRIQIATHPNFRRISHIPFFIRNSFLLLPDFYYLYFKTHGKWPAPREVICMVILSGWHRRLKQQISRNDKTLILDQGPIYMLASLQGFGSERFKNLGTNNWWRKTCKQWGYALDMVVWIDASDEDLVKRVRSREIWHGNKQRSDLMAFEFLAHWRSSLEYALFSVAVGGRQNVVRFDSAEESLDGILNKILVASNLKSS
jgi:adenylate kinase family enzyme